MLRRITFFAGRWWSVALAALLTAGIVIESFVDGDVASAVPFGVVAALALVPARWYSLAAGLASTGVLIAGAIVDPEAIFALDIAGLTAFVAVCIFGSLPDLRDRCVGLAASYAALVTIVVRVSDEQVKAAGVGSTTGLLISQIILFAVGWAVAWIIAGRVRAGRELRLRATRLEAERDLAARDAVAEERARIARELHDVVAHSVSVMTVQAGGVRRLLTEDQARERAALVAIEETGRRALTEMRRMVTVMRDNGTEGSLEPQPGIATLDRLAGEVREAGLPVELTIGGVDAQLPAGVDLSVYRIVQEALTNVMKHAGPAHASVTVTRGTDVVELVVEDDGSRSASVSTGGHGLIGMRERVAVYGGDFEAGPRPGGGFRLRARLPFEPEVTT